MLRKLLFVSLLAVPVLALADGPKPFQLKTEASPSKVGSKGKVTIHIQTREGSHVSAEAPLKIALKGEGVALDKAQLGSDDAVSGKGASPSFEVGYTGQAKGEQKVEATLTFVVCTKELCERESEKVTIPVRVQ